MSEDASEGTWNWLASTRALQRAAFGHDWERIRAEGPRAWNDAVGASVRMNVTALVAELGEFLQELGPVYKDWTTDATLGTKQRDRAVGELVDVGHFLANMLVALDVSDDEWERLYRAKQERNRARMASGTYDGVTGKCPRCRRDLAEAGTYVGSDDGDPPNTLGTYCAGCDAPVDRP